MEQMGMFHYSRALFFTTISYASTSTFALPSPARLSGLPVWVRRPPLGLPWGPLVGFGGAWWASWGSSVALLGLGWVLPVLLLGALFLKFFSKCGLLPAFSENVPKRCSPGGPPGSSPGVPGRSLGVPGTLPWCALGGLCASRVAPRVPPAPWGPRRLGALAGSFGGPWWASWWSSVALLGLLVASLRPPVLAKLTVTGIRKHSHQVILICYHFRCLNGNGVNSLMDPSMLGPSLITIHLHHRSRAGYIPKPAVMPHT